MNILIITSVYPRDDAFKNTSATKVIHYFADEWRKNGNNVFVIHSSSRLLKFTYLLPQKLKDFLKAKTGNEFPDINITKKKEYDYEGIKVFRRPVFKLIPRRLSSKKEIDGCCKDIYEVLKKYDFEPDLIVGHWAVPQIQILAGLSRYFKCRKSIVLHDDYYIANYKDQLIPALEKIDAIGCRSKTISEKVADQLGLDKTPFVCYSGVPDSFINSTEFLSEKYSTPTRKFIYVGELIARKHCDTVIEALAKSNLDGWHLDIVGQGNEREALEQLTKDLGVSNKITFHGRIPRDEVFELMSKAQCFVMPSKGEAFGLVYLEAMAASCITIGSNGEGIDGVIINNKNGVLVEAGSTNDLRMAIERLGAMSTEEALAIALEGYQTALEYSDSKVAKDYLDNILEW